MISKNPNENVLLIRGAHVGAISLANNAINSTIKIGSDICRRVVVINGSGGGGALVRRRNCAYVRCMCMLVQNADRSWSYVQWFHPTTNKVSTFTKAYTSTF